MADTNYLYPAPWINNIKGCLNKTSQSVNFEVSRRVSLDLKSLYVCISNLVIANFLTIAETDMLMFCVKVKIVQCIHVKKDILKDALIKEIMEPANI